MQNFEADITGAAQVGRKDWQDKFCQVMPTPSPFCVNFAVSDAYFKPQLQE